MNKEGTLFAKSEVLSEIVLKSGLFLDVGIPRRFGSLKNFISSS